MKRLPNYAVWILVLSFSLAVHFVISWQVGSEMHPSPAKGSNDQAIQLDLPPPEEPSPAEQQQPKDLLVFDEEWSTQPPETLIVPTSMAPPPPDFKVLSVKAQARGSEGLTNMADLLPPTSNLNTGTGGVKFGAGNALGDGRVAFSPYIAGLREAGLDVVFCIDATGSMGWVIDEVKLRIAELVDIVRILVPIARFGFVAYRDDQGPEFVTRSQELTYSTFKLKRFLSTLEAKGGGDIYEAVDLGIADAINMSGWRNPARKLILVIGDAPLKPARLKALLSQIDTFQQSGGTVSTLDVSEQANPQLLEAKLGKPVSRHIYRNRPMLAFTDIGEAGNGDAATLDGDQVIIKRLITLIIGDQFGSEMQMMLDVL
jgi:hypothetical protein